MKETIRIGVVGGGWPSWQHMKGYSKIEGVEVVALCDLNEERLHRIADEYGIAQRFTSYDEMFSTADLTAVSVCTPNTLHAEVSVAAMEAGLHVLCEKPMASTSQFAQQIMEARDRTGRIFMMGYQRRYGLAAQYLKSRVDRGDLGEIYFARCWWVRRSGIPGMGGWFTNKSLSGGGSLIDIGVHVLDLGLWYMGFPEVTGVSSSWGSHFGVHGLGGSEYEAAKGTGSLFDVDDYAVAHVRFGGGRSLILQTSWASHIKQDEVNVELWGTRGGARYSPLEIYTADDGGHQDTIPQFRAYNEFDEETRHFIDCIRTGTAPASTAEEGRVTVDLIERIYREGESNLV